MDIIYSGVIMVAMMLGPAYIGYLIFRKPGEKFFYPMDEENK